MIDRSRFSGVFSGKGAEAQAPSRPFLNPWAACWGGQDKGGGGHQMQAGSTGGGETMTDDDETPCSQAPAPAAGTLQRVLPIINQRGLHARASAKFVQTVERFEADITVSRCGETVGGLSIMGLMMLAAARGTTITVEAKGPQALVAMDAIEALVADRFGEEV
jgi:phosphocarrier protein